MKDTHNERAYIEQMLKFLDTNNIVAIVGDAYDIFNFIDILGEMKDKIAEKCRGGKIVTVRPDSGNPVQVVLQVTQALDKYFGHTVNSKGYKVLNNVRIIQGDGINEDSIRDILTTLRGYMFSADNVVFGSGGALLQQLNRDTCKFAYKASWARINGKEVEVYKDPITDSGKRSKKGRLMLYRNTETGEFFTGVEGQDSKITKSMLETVFENGKIVKEYTFAEVRANSERN